MTIAAGFLLREGVLLCADTEYTGSSHKSQDSKISWFSFSGGTIAYALAGNEENARAAIDKLERELKSADPKESVRDTIDRVVDRQYRKNVLSYQDRETGDYQLLMAHGGVEGKHSELYVAKRCSVRPIRFYSCIGYGAEFANHILKSQIHMLSSDRDIWNFAAYMLAVVKKAVPYCGGASLLMTMRNQGEVGISTSDIRDLPVHQIEEFSQLFGWYSQRLFVALTNPFSTDESLAYSIEELKTKLIEKRREWAKTRDKWIRQFQDSNPLFADDAGMTAYLAWSMGLPPRDLPVRPTTQSSPERSTADPSPPQPSPELHEGTDES